MRLLQPIVIATCSACVITGCFGLPSQSSSESTSKDEDGEDSSDDEESEEDEGSDEDESASEEDASDASEGSNSSEDDDDEEETSASPATSEDSENAETSEDPSTSSTSNADGSTGGSSEMSSEESTETGPPPCTDLAPENADSIETCATWAYWGECDADWFAGYCDQTCGRCVGEETSGDDTGGDFGPDLGDDNPYPPLNGGSMGFATRYWDCCKPSCAWPENGGAAAACGMGDDNMGVTTAGNACTGGNAFACHEHAPWAHSNVVSYGFAAVNGVGCGTCFQVEFTGATNNESGMDIGSQGLAGKTMIVMATNIGNIAQGQFDLLTPGGGVGDFNACSTQWGVSNGELGAQYGGFMLACREEHGWSGPEAYENSRQCVRERCESVFMSRGLTELYEGCMWYINWFRAADNPQIRYQQVQCPQVLMDRAR